MQSAPNSLDRILVAVDGSSFSLRAADLAFQIAEKFDSELVGVHVASYPSEYLGFERHTILVGIPMGDDIVEDQKKKASQMLQKISRIGESKHIRLATIVLDSRQSIVDSIVDDAAREHIDLIVAGTRGLYPYQTSISGSVSSGLVASARCSVLIVK